MTQQEAEQRRMSIVPLLQEGRTQAEIARAAGVSNMTALRWQRAWQNGQIGGLKSRPITGRRRRLQPWQLQKVWGSGDFSTLGAFAAAIKDTYGFAYNEGHLSRLTRELGLRQSGREKRASAPAPSLGKRETVRRLIEDGWDARREGVRAQ